MRGEELSLCFTGQGPLSASLSAARAHGHILLSLPSKEELGIGAPPRSQLAVWAIGPLSPAPHLSSPQPGLPVSAFPLSRALSLLSAQPYTPLWTACVVCQGGGMAGGRHSGEAGPLQPRIIHFFHPGCQTLLFLLTPPHRQPG